MKESDALLITGSFFIAGEALEYFEQEKTERTGNMPAAFSTPN